MFALPDPYHRAERILDDTAKAVPPENAVAANTAAIAYALLALTEELNALHFSLDQYLDDSRSNTRPIVDSQEESAA